MQDELKTRWSQVEQMVAERFGEKLDVQTILFLIGLQELGLGDKKYAKEEKVDIIHIGICSVLMPYGYYKFIGKDDDGWPHFKNIKKLPHQMTGELQESFMKEAIIAYFDC
ncbi:MAG: hypothetical protein KDD41_12565 [Flavobacteriales bacterium]|nr:hypothetical protein [Flavobacteriales bacterium]